MSIWGKLKVKAEEEALERKSGRTDDDGLADAR